jgi:uncharacterized surface protein with fasciclin (FAS1) repeats
MVRIATRVVALLAAFAAGPALATEEIRFFGDTVMFSTSQILRNLIDSPNHSKFNAAIKAVKLQQALLLSGPYTVFSPTDDAFAKLPADYLDDLFKRVNRNDLAKVVSCHVVAGNDKAGVRLLALAAQDKSVRLTTIGGCVLIVTMRDSTLYVTDERGNEAAITGADVLQSNGMIEIIDRVLLPSH